MAATLAVTRPNGSRSEYTSGGRRHRVRKLAWSGTYANGGNTVLASDVGLTEIEEVHLSGGVATPTTTTSALPLGVTFASDNTSVVFRLYGMAAAAGVGTAPAEFGATAIPSGLNARVTFVGH